MAQIVIPDDQVVLAVDPDTPNASQIVSEVWQVLSSVGIQSDQLRIIQPAGGENDPRSALPDEVREAVLADLVEEQMLPVERAAQPRAEVAQPR